MDVLDTIAELSREYGGPEYVLGGGGNTSCKDETTLWIKPSGTKVKDMTRDSFVAMDRRKIGELYTIRPPKDAVEREKIVKDMMLAAVRPPTFAQATEGQAGPSHGAGRPGARGRPPALGPLGSGGKGGPKGGRRPAGLSGQALGRGAVP